MRRSQATKSPCPPEPAAPLLNRATQGLFPPGSTFKTITAAAALDDGVYTPDSTFDDPGYCTEYGKKVSNALDQSGPEAFGVVNFVEAYEHSINAVFCNIGQKLGAARILDEAKKFGFYSVPPLETPADARSASGLYHHGSLFDPKSSSQLTQVDPGRLAFGQETMLATPLQMALVAAAVANGGVEMKPTLIKEVLAPGGSVVTRLHPHVLRQATKPETAGELRDMMVKVVQGGTGTSAQIPGRRRRRQDRNRRDRRAQRLRRVVHLLRPGRQSGRRRGRRRREPAERLRRGDRGADREADHAGDSCRRRRTTNS